ncbi:MAG TPA: hypothetical protein VF461_15375 [Gemmatimonadaceae bacterium]
MIDPTNRVVALCAEGMAMEGSPDEAMRLFEEAWASRTDDFEAAIAAHFVARHQPTPADTLHWNALAVHHAELVLDRRAEGFLASLYLNLADAHERVGERESAVSAVKRAAVHLDQLPDGGYREFVASGIRRLAERLDLELDIQRAD